MRLFFKKKTFIAMIIVIAGFFLYAKYLHSPLIYKLIDRYSEFNTTRVPDGLDSLSSKECGGCHVRIYKEWQTSKHAKAYTNPYFQAYLKKDDYNWSCYYCHTQLEKQLELKIIGFVGDDLRRPILDINPDFDSALRDEGVNCATCHVKDGVIYGPYENVDAPHDAEFNNRFLTIEICKPCHEVPKSGFMFYRSNPCGTIDEYNEGPYKEKGVTCQQCHMPGTMRKLARSSRRVRNVGAHTFKGGSSKEMLRKALYIDIKKNPKNFELVVMNNGAGHTFPTGDPDRVVRIITRFYDFEGSILLEEVETLKRTIIYYPIIIELSDSRLGPLIERTYTYKGKSVMSRAMRATVDIEYHILSERAHKRLVKKYGLPQETERVIKLKPVQFTF